MVRFPLLLSVWCLALALPAGAQSVTKSPSSRPAQAPPVAKALPNSAACDPKAPEPEDPQYLWRLRAFRHLDCVADIVQHAMQRGEGEGPSAAGGADTVAISRQELEQIQKLALWARDAAARIGR